MTTAQAQHADSDHGLRCGRRHECRRAGCTELLPPLRRRGFSRVRLLAPYHSGVGHELNAPALPYPTRRPHAPCEGGVLVLTGCSIWLAPRMTAR